MGNEAAMSRKVPESRWKPWFRRWSQVQIGTTFVFAALIILIAVAVGDFVSVLIGLAVAAIAYVAHRAYWDNE